jgi:hypothetical protein
MCVAHLFLLSQLPQSDLELNTLYHQLQGGSTNGTPGVKTAWRKLRLCTHSGPTADRIPVCLVKIAQSLIVPDPVF